MPIRIVYWTSSRVGHRGMMAFILGLIWTLIGISVVTTPQPVPLPDLILPSWLRAAFWLVPGVYAMAWTLLTSVVRQEDHNVWGLLMIGPTVRVVTFVAAGIMDVADIGHDQEKYHGQVLGILVWSAVLAMVAVCAIGLDRLPPPRPEGKHGLN